MILGTMDTLINPLPSRATPGKKNSCLNIAAETQVFT